ncbi:MAG: hypothetical protein ACOWWM_00315 [Desulfobacterales bacterium]
MGCRYPIRWGGRGLDWVTTCMVMEEVGVLGYIFASIVDGRVAILCRFRPGRPPGARRPRR